MRKLLALCLALVAFNVAAQWSNGTNLWPSSPVGIGQQAHNSIMFGVRCLDATCQGPTGPGQRGISSDVMFNSQATVYAAGIHSHMEFAPGSYTVPIAYRIRATDEAPLPSGVSISTLYGLYVSDVIKGVTNYAIHTDAGPVSFGDSVTIRSGSLTVQSGSINGPINASTSPGTRSVIVGNGSILSFYDATGAEIGRIQAASGDVVWTVLSGKLNINGSVKITSLAGSGTRVVYAQSDGSLVAP